MNPLELLQFKNSYDTFVRNHPKFPLFLKAVHQNGLAEGNVIEISVKSDTGNNYTTNIRLTGSDLELLRQLREMM